MDYYPNNCTIEYTLRRDEVISKALQCVSANSHLEILCNQFGADRKELGIRVNELEIGALTPTQSQIEKWKYKKVSKSKKWDGPNNEFFKEGDEIDYSEEPIVVLHCDYGSESGTYILSGHTRTMKRSVDGKKSIKAIVITTSNRNIHEAYSNIASNLVTQFAHRAVISDLDRI